MTGRWRSVLLALAIVASVCWAVLAYTSVVGSSSPTLGAIVALSPIAVVAVLAGRRGKPGVTIAAVLAIGAAAWLGWSALERHFASVLFVEHAGTNLLLAIVFARTLAPGHEPLCTRFARLIHGGLPPGVGPYTRQLTLAWAVFFTVMFVSSCALYAGRFLTAWSILATILTPALIVAMFAVEYAIRMRVLPAVERVGILGGIRAFSRHFASRHYEMHH